MDHDPLEFLWATSEPGGDPVDGIDHLNHHSNVESDVQEASEGLDMQEGFQWPDNTVEQTNSCNSRYVYRQLQNNAGERRHRTRFTQEGERVLLQQFDVDPYPSDDTIEHLVKLFGVDRQIINRWFSNRRARWNHRDDAPTSSSPEKCDRIGRNSPTPANSSLSQDLTESNLHAMLHGLEKRDDDSPLAKYLQEPLEEDPAGYLAIRNKNMVASASYSLQNFETRPGPYYRPAAVNSAASSSSVSSSISSRSHVSEDSRGGRKGRRKKVISSRQTTYYIVPSVQFWCTFCGKTFPKSSEWRRHETTVHAPRRFWVCEEPECIPKPFDSKVFVRRDQFQQHFRKHGTDRTCPLPRAADPIPPDHPALLCGFCGVRLVDWNKRLDHIAEHFNSGCHSSEWWLKRLDCSYEGALAEEGWLLPPEDVIFLKKCTYCQRVFSAAETALPRQECSGIWSCRELPGVRHTFRIDHWDGIYERTCNYCSELFPLSDDWTDLLEHIVEVHNFRGCKQEKYTDRGAFLEHLRDFHNSTRENVEFGGQEESNFYSGAVFKRRGGFSALDKVLPIS